MVIGARADSLDAIFARMDEASRKFKSVSADMHRTDYTAVLNDSTQEDGRLWLKRGKNGIGGKVEFLGQDARTIAFQGNLLRIYWPKAKQVQDVDISKYTSPEMVDQMLLLSFGAASGSEIQKDYDVSVAGTDKIDSKTVTRVELLPKSPELKKEIARITLWIPEGEARAIKEKVDEPSKDYVLWTYSNVRMNGLMKDSDIELKLPSGVKRMGSK